LLADLGTHGNICVYSQYEKSTIKALANHLPDLADELLALLPRIWDLLPIIQRHYYHPEFHGSYSIKSVLPALVPNLSYDDMEIADGRTAVSRYETARTLDDEVARNQIFSNLRTYCRQDTEAMIELRRALARRAD
jgi:hypothetical protein